MAILLACAATGCGDDSVDRGVDDRESQSDLGQAASQTQSCTLNSTNIYSITVSSSPSAGLQLSEWRPGETLTVSEPSTLANGDVTYAVQLDQNPILKDANRPLAYPRDGTNLSREGATGYVTVTRNSVTCTASNPAAVATTGMLSCSKSNFWATRVLNAQGVQLSEWRRGETLTVSELSTSANGDV